MKSLFVAIALTGFVTVASAQGIDQASEAIARQIGILVIQNSNLTAQLQAAQAELKALKEKPNAKQEPTPGKTDGGSRP